MYWTKGTEIMKTLMDGTGSFRIVSGLDHPVGIAVDYKSSRLFWVEQHSKNVKSSSLDGSAVATVAQLTR